MMYKLPVYRVQLVREKSVSAPSRTIDSPKDAATIFRELHGAIDRECLIEIMLDARNNVRGIHTVSIGDLSSAIAHPREVFKSAILSSAASIVLLHNHPSGVADPSPDDIAISRRIKSAGEILGIDLTDSIVVGDHGFVSLRETGYL